MIAVAPDSPLARFQSLLRELFQFDSADLDFGIYRILNARRGLFEDWIEARLPAAVRKALSSGAVAQSDANAKHLGELAAKLREEQEDDAVIDGDGRLREGITGKTAREYRALWQAQQASAQPASVDAREAGIYNRLYDFFRRYYEDGDFLSLRRYGSDDAYAVPWNGQEVMLHWANKDQYYVKTGEHFTDYRFRAGNSNDAWNVEFRLRQAETDRDNTKSADKRHFFFDAGAVEIDAGARTLALPVAWRAASAAEAANLPGRNAQDALNAETEKKLLGKQAVKVQPALLAALKANVSEDDDKPQTLLARHLRRYTRRNTSDFFIHKDLRGFLTRELDYWLKAEVLKLDTLLAGGEQPAQAWLQTLACLREVAATIIDFVARIEDFQKKLYEKRKFITACHWCATLDHVERAGLTERLVEILNTTDGGKVQKAEWKHLYAIDEVKAEGGKPGWKDKVTAEFLRSQPFLVLDTVHMPQEFTDALLASFDNLDAATDGLLVHGDNWQALNLLMERYREQVQCVYIDPPYNTGKDEFVYRDSYKDSNWLASISQSTSAAYQLLKDDAPFSVSIGDDELHRLRSLLHTIFGESNFLANFVWNNEGNLDNQSKVKINHEYVLSYCKNQNAFPSPQVIAPDIGPNSKLYNDTIENSITKNGRANPPSEVTLPAGFPASVDNGMIPARDDAYPQLSRDVEIVDGAIKRSVKAVSGWSSRDLLDTFIENECRPIRDAKGLLTWFKITPSGAIYGYKTRENTSHVLSVIRGVGTVKKMSGALSAMGFEFKYPKPIALVTYLNQLVNEKSGVHLDYFAGSGTTAQSVVEMNRADDGTRRYIVVEMGKHFNDLIVPRMKKVGYSLDWKDGKPVSRNGSSLAFKYLRLESYEDTLSNLRLRADAPGQGGLDLDALPEEYRLGYWLDVETCGSASLLDVEQLERPFDYVLSVHDGKAARTQSVDLAETFNYLIGLIVRQRRVLDRDGCRYLLYTGRTRADDAATAVLWRDIKGWKEADFAAERDWIASAAPFGEAVVIYVNGDSAIPGAQSLDPVFHARMFAPVH